MTGLPIEYFLDIELKEKEIPGLPGVTPRIIMQKLATDFIREMIYPDFWLWRMRQSLSKFSHNHIIIDDVRFNNEAQLIRDNGGIIIHLNRDFKDVTEQTEHKSEKGISVHTNDYMYHAHSDLEITASELLDFIDLGVL